MSLPLAGIEAGPSTRAKPVPQTRHLRLFRIMAIVISVTVGCGSMEALLRILEPPHRKAEATPAWESDPVYALRYTKGYPTTDGNTFANVRPFAIDSTMRRIAFIGDSYIDGQTLQNPMLAIPAKVEARLRQRLGEDTVEAMNFGLSSTGPVHYYVRYCRIVARYHPQIVVVALHDNDVLDASEFNRNPPMRPILARDPLSAEITGVSFAQAPVQSVARRVLRRSAIYRFIRFREPTFSPLQRGDGFEQQLAVYLEPRDEEAIESESQFYYWTRRLADAISADRAVPVFIYLPAKQCVIDSEASRTRAIYGLECDYGRFERRLAAWMEENHLKFHSFLGSLRDQDAARLYLPEGTRGGGGTGHLNADGNDFVASLLEPILLEAMASGGPNQAK